MDSMYELEEPKKNSSFIKYCRFCCRICDPRTSTKEVLYLVTTACVMCIFLMLLCVITIPMLNNLARVKPTNSPDNLFAASRAMYELKNLTSEIGTRVIFSEANIKTVDWITEKIENVLRLRQSWVKYELDYQGFSIKYDTGRKESVPLYNVMLKVYAGEGKSNHSLMFSGHYDSHMPSPGAGDDGTAMVIMLELLRNVISNKDPLVYPVVFVWNNGEEMGLYGSHAFRNHKWFEDVGRFVNLDSMTGKGRMLMTQVAPTSLTVEVAKLNPYANSFSMQLMNLVSSSTDFVEYHDRQKLDGFDFSFYKYSYYYHSILDNLQDVDPSSLQEIGNTLNSFLNIYVFDEKSSPLASGEKNDDKTSYIFFNILGLMFVSYSSGFSIATSVINIIFLLLVFLFKFTLLDCLLLPHTRALRKKSFYNSNNMINGGDEDGDSSGLPLSVSSKKINNGNIINNKSGGESGSLGSQEMMLMAGMSSVGGGSGEDEHVDQSLVTYQKTYSIKSTLSLWWRQFTKRMLFLGGYLVAHLLSIGTALASVLFFTFMASLKNEMSYFAHSYYTTFFVYPLSTFLGQLIPHYLNHLLLKNCCCCLLPKEEYIVLRDEFVEEKYFAIYIVLSLVYFIIACANIQLWYISFFCVFLGFGIAFMIMAESFLYFCFRNGMLKDEDSKMGSIFEAAQRRISLRVTDMEIKALVSTREGVDVIDDDERKEEKEEEEEEEDTTVTTSDYFEDEKQEEEEDDDDDEEEEEEDVDDEEDYSPGEEREEDEGEEILGNERPSMNARVRRKKRKRRKRRRRRNRRKMEKVDEKSKLWRLFFGRHNTFSSVCVSLCFEEKAMYVCCMPMIMFIPCMFAFQVFYDIVAALAPMYTRTKTSYPAIIMCLFSALVAIMVVGVVIIPLLVRSSSNLGKVLCLTLFMCVLFNLVNLVLFPYSSETPKWVYVRNYCEEDAKGSASLFSTFESRDINTLKQSSEEFDYYRSVYGGEPSCDSTDVCTLEFGRDQLRVVPRVYSVEGEIEESGQVRLTVLYNSSTYTYISLEPVGGNVTKVIWNDEKIVKYSSETKEYSKINVITESWNGLVTLEKGWKSLGLKINVNYCHYNAVPYVREFFDSVDWMVMIDGDMKECEYLQVCKDYVLVNKG